MLYWHQCTNAVPANHGDTCRIECVEECPTGSVLKHLLWLRSPRTRHRPGNGEASKVQNGHPKHWSRGVRHETKQASPQGRAHHHSRTVPQTTCAPIFGAKLGAPSSAQALARLWPMVGLSSAHALARCWTKRLTKRAGQGLGPKVGLSSARPEVSSSISFGKDSRGQCDSALSRGKLVGTLALPIKANSTHIVFICHHSVSPSGDSSRFSRH